MDIHFNSYKIKYQLLDYYMKPIRTSQIVRSVNIFINLDDLLHRLHKPIINREFQCCGKNASRQMVSNIFNLVGHYKNWAVKRYLIPRIFLVYTSANKIFKNHMYVPTYRKHYIEINSPDSGDFYFINDAILTAEQIIPTIAKYLRNVYAIDTRYLEPSTAPMYLADKYKADWNLLISRDEYDLQYAYKDHWSVISPKGDNSTFVTRENFWNHILNTNGIDTSERIYYSTKLFVDMKAIAGDKYRSIPKLKRCGWKTIFAYLAKVASDTTPSESVCAIQEANFCKLLTDKKLDTDEINDHLYCIDVARQVNSFLQSDCAIIDSCITDMEDFASLSKINTSIFQEFPLNLAFLCRDKIEDTTPR